MGPGHTAPAVEEVPIGPDPTVALNTGYALSKYVGSFPMASFTIFSLVFYLFFSFPSTTPPPHSNKIPPSKTNAS